MSETDAKTPRSLEVVNREVFNFLFSLCRQQPWASQRQNEIADALASCSNGDEYKLICDLLHRFDYISRGDLDAAFDIMASTVIDEWGCTQDDTVIVGVKRSSYADSSAMVVYEMKSALQNLQDWSVTNFITKYSDCVELVPNGGRVILCDEFVGSGKTVKKAAKWISEKLIEAKKSAEIRVCAVAAMYQSQERVCEICPNFFATRWLRRGISDHFQGNELTEAKLHMAELEKRLAADDENRKLANYAFGYNKAESIYYRERGNVPNNVFPYFWWRRETNGNLRRPILKRAQ